ncbi:hypothetical protein [Nitrosomonas ureae]|uniref:Uncharacterized protein n=1 Tax=Nitrosomonas ureae TaxID=44577 RepID=A0A1H9CUU5_9PROT|nr:hypothetical protein [Nitrosomonas ureae]SEQ04980.1 hypothetical protein SAMN05421510_10179 [Nitrosomonas ureae]
MTTTRIQFCESQSSFSPAKRPRDEDWIDTSFSNSPGAVGRLRLPGVSNGRYESRHPILDVNGTTVGYLIDGAISLGYTFTCVYAGNCFWITHQSLSATLHGGGSAVSLVDKTGMFWFSSKGAKFDTVKSFGFGSSWVDSIRAFKLLDNGAYLLYLTNYGVCLFDARMRQIVAKVEFMELAYQWSDFALSPKVKLLAIGCSMADHKDPLDGEYRYKNFVRIYNLETGMAIGEQALPGDRKTLWTVNFSEDGHRIGVVSDSSTHVFELTASR